MKVLHQNAKLGEIRLRADTLDDLWHLKHIVGVGDLVEARTFRRDDSATGDTSKPTRGEKRALTLGVRVEAIEFQAFADRLRISGKIETGPTDLGQYHTITVEPRDDIKVIKQRWRMHELLRVKEAVAQTGAPRVAILSIEEGEALIAFVHAYGVRQVATVESRGSGKYAQKSGGRQEFFADVLEQFKMALAGQDVPVVIVGPGFTKEDFLKFAREKARGFFDKAVIDSTAHGGHLGVQDALRRGTFTRVVESHRLVEETQLVEKLFDEVAKEAKGIYGPKQVEKALKAGAVETLLVADSIVRRVEVDKLLEVAAEAKARTVVISTENEAGKRLEGLTGIAALLKFKMG